MEVVKENDIDNGAMVWDKILLRRRVNPQKVTLSNGRIFYAKYQTVSRKNLGANVTTERIGEIRPRQQQQKKQNNKEQGCLVRHLFSVRNLLDLPLEKILSRKELNMR